jgi:hypothetical protein
MQDVKTKFSPGLPWQKQQSKRSRLLFPASWTKIKDESSKLLHLERSLYGAETWSLRNKD